LSVIAEGIENRATADYLVSRGCEEGRGYFFGRPMPANEFEQKILISISRYRRGCLSDSRCLRLDWSNRRRICLGLLGVGYTGLLVSFRRIRSLGRGRHPALIHQGLHRFPPTLRHFLPFVQSVTRQVLTKHTH
jgi:hypothetical protein